MPTTTFTTGQRVTVWHPHPAGRQTGTVASVDHHGAVLVDLDTGERGPFQAATLRAADLYEVDNGALLCTAHLGTSAALTGRDTSGQPIVRLTAADIEAMRADLGPALAHLVACETCRAIA